MSDRQHTTIETDGLGDLGNDAFEELASRESNGIHVSLLWRRCDGHVKVSVFDAGSETGFDLDVAGDSPFDVFHHPFAYAAFRNLDVAPRIESELVSA
jgi:hypothetical protein